MLQAAFYGIMIALYALSIPFTIANVAKPRKPLSVGQAIAIVTIDVAFIVVFVLLLARG